MAWSTIRKAEPDEITALREAARSFAVRHKLPELSGDMDDVLELELLIDSDQDYSAKLRGQWRRIVRRILDCEWAEGVAYGYVGYHCD